MSWKYSDPNEWEKAITSEVFPLEDVAAAYIEWEKEDIYSILENKETREIIPALQVKRGNRAYSKKQRRKILPVTRAMYERKFDTASKDARQYTSRYTRAIFLTLEYNPHEISLQDAWLSLKGKGSDLNLFKAKLNRFFSSSVKGNRSKTRYMYRRSNNPVTYSSHARKEAHESGYPHVHMILILSEPVYTYYHKKSQSWRLPYEDVVLPIKQMWAESVGCQSAYCDVQAIVDASITEKDTGVKRSVMSYVLKYVTKDVDASNPKSVNTHALQKFFGVRDIFSSKFLSDLDVILNRRDKTEIELKRTIKEIKRIEKLKDHFGYLTSDLPEKLTALYERKAELQEELRRLKNIKWYYIGTRKFASIQEYAEFYMRIEKYNMQQLEVYRNNIISDSHGLALV